MLHFELTVSHTVIMIIVQTTSTLGQICIQTLQQSCQWILSVLTGHTILHSLHLWLPNPLPLLFAFLLSKLWQYTTCMTGIGSRLCQKGCFAQPCMQSNILPVFHIEAIKTHLYSTILLASELMSEYESQEIQSSCRVYH